MKFASGATLAAAGALTIAAAPLAAHADPRGHGRQPWPNHSGHAVPPGLAKKPRQMPPGLAKKYYGVGERLPAAWFGERHRLGDPTPYGLRHAPPGHRWVVVDGDAYLVRTRTGVIADVAKAILR